MTQSSLQGADSEVTVSEVTKYDGFVGFLPHTKKKSVYKKPSMCIFGLALSVVFTLLAGFKF